MKTYGQITYEVLHSRTRMPVPAWDEQPVCVKNQWERMGSEIINSFAKGAHKREPHVDAMNEVVSGANQTCDAPIRGVLIPAFFALETCRIIA